MIETGLPGAAPAPRDVSIEQMRMPGATPTAAVARQAVVLIHGMGEQIPMDTIKGFVGTVWKRNRAIASPDIGNPTQVWSKPDERTGSLELRRITTRESIASEAFPAGVRTDFYELYWADLTAGSTWSQFVAWVRYLLFRWPARVPRRLLFAWGLLWLGTIIVLVLGGLTFVPEGWWTAHMPHWLGRKMTLAAAAFVLTMLHTAATQSFGRVVRYTRAEPDNIAARKAVRERGLALLRALHADTVYSRVVVASHSLGTMLAHDLISYFWAEQAAARTIAVDSPAFAALARAEAAAAALDAARSVGSSTLCAAREEFFQAQAALGDALRSAAAAATRTDQRWLITDLLTLGCPLAHAEVLVAKGMADLVARETARELPTSPPYREALDPDVLAAAKATNALPIAREETKSRLMSFPATHEAKQWVLHYAAPFAAVRWTNVWDRSRFAFFGDVISGPVVPQFGAGILDINLAAIDGQSWRFSHTRYWSKTASRKRLNVLRDALNLLDDKDRSTLPRDDGSRAASG